jgi:hypothetical protein
MLSPAQTSEQFTLGLEACSRSRCCDPSTLCRTQEFGERVSRPRCKRHFPSRAAAAVRIAMRYAEVLLPPLPGPPVACHRNCAESGLWRRRLRRTPAGLREAQWRSPQSLFESRPIRSDSDRTSIRPARKRGRTKLGMLLSAQFIGTNGPFSWLLSIS